MRCARQNADTYAGDTACAWALNSAVVVTPYQCPSA